MGATCLTIALIACRPSATVPVAACPCPLETPGLMSLATLSCLGAVPAPHGATSPVGGSATIRTPSVGIGRVRPWSR